MEYFRIFDTRWAPKSYKWSYNPYKWPYKWLTWGITLLIGVITSLITIRGPPCINSSQIIVPGDSKWPVHPPVGGHLTICKGHLTIPKRVTKNCQVGKFSIRGSFGIHTRSFQLQDFWTNHSSDYRDYRVWFSISCGVHQTLHFPNCGDRGLVKNAWNFNLCIRWMQIRVSMEVGNWCVSWFITYLRDLQPTFMGL